MDAVLTDEGYRGLMASTAAAALDEWTASTGESFSKQYAPEWWMEQQYMKEMVPLSLRGIGRIHWYGCQPTVKPKTKATPCKCGCSYCASRRGR
jgi:hypothetical protein